jgi:hypothetical protein
LLKKTEKMISKRACCKKSFDLMDFFLGKFSYYFKLS